MDEIEMSLFRQRRRIQQLHQVQFGFDALEPHFINALRAFYNRRRCWTTQIRFGNLYHHHLPHLDNQHPNITSSKNPAPP